MNVKDFRVGNYVKPVTGNFLTNKMCENKSLSDNQIAVITVKGLFDLEKDLIDIEFIPITEERLLKFEFKKHNVNFSGADMWQGMDAWSINSEWLFRGSPEIGLKLVEYYNTNIRYIYQLQNIYYTVTSNELIIKN